MQQAILDLIDKKANKAYGTLQFHQANLLEELRDEVQSLGDGWIPVSEKLPEEGIYVLGYNQPSTYQFFVCILSKCTHQWINPYGIVTQNITHWMPLPLSPNK